MKLVMTLLARDEADIVDAQIAFHLHAGVDFVIATDNGSTDGTTEILERWERTGRLHLSREGSADLRQGEWVTRMARMAAAEFGADWVINSDADEFWWPRGGSLKEILGLVPRRYGVVRGVWRHFLPRPAQHPDFAERMTARLCRPGKPGDERTIYHAHQKVAHRADPQVEVESGNHNVWGRGLEPLRTWHPIEVLHFSLRSVEQIEKKGRGGWRRSPTDARVEHQRRLDSAVDTGRASEFFGSHVVSDAALVRGLKAGTLVIDVRLRDALRAIRAPDESFVAPEDGAFLHFPAPDPADVVAYATEISMLAGVDGIARAEERLAAFEVRLASSSASRGGPARRVD